MEKCDSNFTYLFLDRKRYIFHVVALFILVLLQLVPLMYTQCLATMKKIEIVYDFNVAKQLGGCYNFSSGLLAVLAKNCCVWTDFFF